MTEFKLTIPRKDVLSIINMLKTFEQLCEERDIKFGKYTPEQVWEVVRLYKNWKTYPDSPPF